VEDIASGTLQSYRYMERARAVTQSLLLVKCIMAVETLSIGLRHASGSIRMAGDGPAKAGWVLLDGSGFKHAIPEQSLNS
jgi:hypothetical protein